MERPYSQNNLNKDKLKSRLIITIIAALIIVMGVFWISKMFQNRVDRYEQIDDAMENARAAEIIPGNYIPHPLTGELIDPEQAPHNLFAVMVENSSDAWPLAGLSQAGLVIEAPVEGLIPRFMVVFGDEREIERIGPVRSARPYYLDWAWGVDAMYVHVGGSPEALQIIGSREQKSLNQFYWSQFFWRSADRSAPHNVYTSIDLLKKGYSERGYEIASEPIEPVWKFSYENHNDSDNEKFLSEIVIEFSHLSDNYDAVWKYNSDEQNYTRWQGNEQQYDDDFSEIKVKNIVIIYTDIQVVDEVGRRQIRTKGEGEAQVISEGRLFEVKWNKENDNEKIRFYTLNNSEYQFNPGTTWIEIVPVDKQIQIKYEENISR